MCLGVSKAANTFTLSRGKFTSLHLIGEIYWHYVISFADFKSHKGNRINATKRTNLSHSSSEINRQHGQMDEISTQKTLVQDDESVEKVLHENSFSLVCFFFLVLKSQTHTHKQTVTQTNVDLLHVATDWLSKQINFKAIEATHSSHYLSDTCMSHIFSLLPSQALSNCGTVKHGLLLTFKSVKCKTFTNEQWVFFIFRVLFLSIFFQTLKMIFLYLK